jgi:peptide/nickel transport system substrate-binding protein
MTIVERRVSRRTALAASLSIGAAGLLAACGPMQGGSGSAPAQPAKPGAATSAPAAKPAEQPKSGGALKLITPEPAMFDPHVINLDNWDNLYQAHDTLAEYDRNLKPIPQLAESWDLTADYKQIKINLRKGVTFHSGREFTSDDVKYNLLRVRDPKKVAAQTGAWSGWWTTIETPDKNTIVLKSEQSRPAVFDLFEYLNITDPVTMDALDTKTQAATSMVGTGPYRLAEYRQGEFMRFTKNPNYWQSGKPYMDEVTTMFSGDLQSAIVQLEAGAVDHVTRPPIRDAARLTSDNRYAVRKTQGSGQFWLLTANTTLAPTDNKKVRQAINFALDRKRLAEAILLNQAGGPVNLPWPEHSPAYQGNKNATYTYDLDKAKALLAGLTLPEMEIITTPLTAQINEFAQIIQSDLAKIGVTMKINNMERAAATPYTRELKYRGINLGLGGFSQMNPAAAFGSSYYAPAAGANVTGFAPEKYVQLINAFSTETDAAKQKQAYSDMNDLMLDESFTVPIVAQEPAVISRSYVKGVRWRIGLVPVWADMWLDK